MNRRMILRKIMILVVAVTVTIAMAPLTFAPVAEAQSSQGVSGKRSFNVVDVSDYGTLQTALNKSGNIAKLSQNIEISGTLQMATNYTGIDLNGYTLSSSVAGTATNKSNIIEVTGIGLSIDSSVAGGRLSVDKEYQNGIVMSSSGKLEIMDGEFYAGTAGGDTIIDLKGSGGNVNIEDGVFDMQYGSFGQYNRAIAEETNNMTTVNVSKALFKGYGPGNTIKFFAMRNKNNLITDSESTTYVRADGGSTGSPVMSDKILAEADTGNYSIAVYRTVGAAGNDIYVYKGASLKYDLSSNFSNFNNSVSAQWTVNGSTLSKTSPTYENTTDGYKVSTYDKGDNTAHELANMADITYTGSADIDVNGSLKLSDVRYADCVPADKIVATVPMRFNFLSSMPAPDNFAIDVDYDLGMLMLHWYSISGVDEYHVELSDETGKIFDGNVTGTWLPAKISIKKGTVYTGKVAGIQDTVTGAGSEKAVMTRPGETGNPKAVMLGTDKIVLSWDKAEKAAGYYIECYKDGKFFQNYIGTDYANDTIDVEPGGDYEIGITPFILYNGASVESNTVYVKITAPVAPETPAVTTPTAPEPASAVKAPSKVTIKTPTTKLKTITIKWKKVSCTGYQVYIAQNSRFTRGLKKYTVTKSTTLFKNVTKLKKGTRYYVKVRAYTTSGSTSYFGKWSKTKSIRCK